jgi:hypothetical protein
VVDNREAAEPTPEAAHAAALAELESLIAAAPDQDARERLLAIRETLTGAQAQELLARAQGWQGKATAATPLEFHVLVVPALVQMLGLLIGGGVGFTLLFRAFDAPSAARNGALMIAGLWLAVGAALWSSGRWRRYSVVFDASRFTASAVGDRFAALAAGTMDARDIASLQERAREGVLEITARSGERIEIPMSINNYPGLLRALRSFSGIR